jgi:type I restriction enzyme S subunit
MSELPEGWVETTLGDVSTAISGVGFPKHYQGKTQGAYPFAKVRDISKAVIINNRLISEADNYIDDHDIKNMRAHLIPSGSTIFAKIGEGLHLNRRALTSCEMLIDNNCMAVAPNVLAVDKRYLFHFLTTVSLSYLAVSTAVPSVRKGDVEKIKLPLPPLPEQRRIVAKLDRLFARTSRARADLGHIPQLIERYKQAILRKAFSGELTADWRQACGVERGSEISVGEVAETIRYGSSAKSAPTGDVPVLRMGNIQDMFLDWKNLVYTSDEDEIQKYVLAEGDLLFNRTNSPELVGKTAIYRGEQPAIFAGYLIQIRCGRTVLPEFLNYCLNSPQGREYCWIVKSDSVSQSNINAKKLAQFSFVLPNIAEQEEIVSRVNRALTWVERIGDEIEAVDNLQDSLSSAILGKAFSGNLVPQDPNDEPASELLDRIRTERAARSNNGRNHRRK